MTKRRARFFDDMGLCLHDGAMVYGMEHGALRWAPMWAKRTICHVWNKVHCAVAGHDPIGEELYKCHVAPGPPKCVNCSATMKIDGRYPTPEEIAAHDELCYKEFEKMHKQGVQDQLWDDNGFPI